MNLLILLKIEKYQVNKKGEIMDNELDKLEKMKLSLEKQNFKMPTPEEIWERANDNENALSKWYPSIKDNFKTPETLIIPIDSDTLNWLESDKYLAYKIEEFKNYLISYIHKNNFNTNRKLFLKTGNFSNKFEFTACTITDIDDIGKKALDIFYVGMCVSCPSTTEFVIREFIDTDYERPSIYSGMKLNTEFRVFYDFDTNKTILIVNYWDKDTMIHGLEFYPDDLETFMAVTEELEKDYEKLKPQLQKLVNSNMKNVKGLKGKWSIDFMYDGKEFWLIDMALAEDSYYYDKMLEALKVE